MTHRDRLTLAALAAAVAFPAAAAPAVLTSADYDRAARFLPQHQERYILNSSVTPHWVQGADRFWFREALADDRARFVLVDAATGARKPAFDHAAVAKGLGEALGRAVDAERLPFRTFRFGANGAVEAIADGKLWRCAATCVGSAPPVTDPSISTSPDGRWQAFVKDHNLWVRPTGGGDAFALTKDGVDGNAWADLAGDNPAAIDAKVEGRGFPPSVLWSPDSRRLYTQRIDQRQLPEMGIVRSTPLDGSQRPQIYRWRSAQGGDAVLPTSEPWVFDLDSRQGRKVQLAPIPTPFSTAPQAREVWWSPDGSRLNLITRSRYLKTVTLYAIEPATGAARQLISETGKTFVEPSPVFTQPMTRTLANGDILWFSERDGWGRLYLYDAAGQLKRALSTGDGLTNAIVRLDEAKGQVYVRAKGREPGLDPYFENLYRIDLNTGASVRLTPEAANHEVHATADTLADQTGDPLTTLAESESFSPSGRYFLDTFSTPTEPSQTVLRRADGKLVSVVARADISLLKSEGFTPPERFSVMAADGVTPIYGVILRPSNFDPARKYPVVDSIYPGPQMRRVVNPGFSNLLFDNYSFPQSMAELGFVVVLIDGRGTPGRSKTFLDQSYGKLSSAGTLEDHVAGIKALGAQRPYMDLDRVGIYGYSGGGYGTARALFAYPDFYKVGVAHAGNHDQRGYIAVWGDSYNGPDDGKNYLAASNALIAKNLKGKLLLTHGDMDTNVSPALTMQVVDALIKANKDFDMLLVPNLGHRFDDYLTRVTWDYFVRNLMGATPPKEYRIH
jgi:dipeptidyl-peptidase-4